MNIHSMTRLLASGTIATLGLAGCGGGGDSTTAPDNHGADDAARQVQATAGFAPATAPEPTTAGWRILAGEGAPPGSEPQWHPTDPKLLYVIENLGAEVNVKRLDVETGQVKVVGDLRTRLKALFPSGTPTNMHTGGEGSPSKDGRYWCVMVRDQTRLDANGNFRMMGVITWDRNTDTVLGALHQDSIPDRVSMSPSGKLCVISRLGTGVVSYTRDMKNPVKLYAGTEHSDLAVDANGRDVCVGVSYNNQLGVRDGDVFVKDLETGTGSTLFNIYGADNGGTHATNVHFSGKAHNKPGWVVVTTNADNNDGSGPRTKWIDRKVMAVQLKWNPVIYNLASTRTGITAATGRHTGCTLLLGARRLGEPGFHESGVQLQLGCERHCDGRRPDRAAGECPEMKTSLSQGHGRHPPGSTSEGEGKAPPLRHQGAASAACRCSLGNRAMRFTSA
jgi:hypothetical protein